MESCIRISLSEHIDPDQSQRFDLSGRNEIRREPFPPARTCDTASRAGPGPPVWVVMLQPEEVRMPLRTPPHDMPQTIP